MHSCTFEAEAVASFTTWAVELVDVYMSFLVHLWRVVFSLYNAVKWWP